MRKITSGMAALALCVSLSVPTFAATGYASGTVNRNDYTPSTTTTTPQQPTKPRLPPQIAQKQKPS